MRSRRIPATPIVDRPRQEEQAESRTSLRCPILQGRWITAVVNGQTTQRLPFSAGTNTTYAHGLGRLPRGYLITRLTGAAAASWREVTLDATALTLVFTVTSTADIWIF